MATQKEDEFPTIEEVLSNADSRMSKTVEAVQRELGTLRTGRATPSVLENLTVEYYGVPTPLNQLATITAPEARLIMIQPWDKQALRDVEKSILKSELGFNPTNDGNVIRVPVPPLSQERRLELVKLLKKKIEDGKVAARNVRRDALEGIRSMERAKVISQDDNRRAQEQLQKATNSYVARMDEVSSAKETEIMQV